MKSVQSVLPAHEEDRVLDLRNAFDEKKLFIAFEVSLWFKGVFALAEAVSGVAAYLASPRILLSLVLWVTRGEFAEDPHDLVAHCLLHSVQHLSVTAQKFAAVYLLAHGLLKLWLIVGLLRRRLWYYPVSMVVFAFFIAYQIYRYTLTHSVWLLLLTAMDAVVIALTWHEYRYLLFRRDLNGIL
ncbi:DUF2127 domain-containing protein [Paraburkholderia sp. B3]|uniref:DUF2127 domain-containing protein n=1 Tax=Paraburkholderia sp. B3 TaxID=3134791 RepID=UPI003981D85A